MSSAKPGNPFQVIRVRTAARLDRLEDVLILLSQQELVPKKTAESGGAKENQANSQGVVHPVTPPLAAERALKNPVPSNAVKPGAPSGEHTASPAPRQAPAARITDMEYTLNSGAQAQSSIEVHKYTAAPWSLRFPGAGFAGRLSQVRPLVGAGRFAAIGDHLFRREQTQSRQRHVSGSSRRYSSGCP